MKKFYTIFLSAALTLFMVGCEGLNELPVFEESESFASMPQSSFGVNEDCGQLVIPVQIACIKPVSTVVSYEIVEGTAKAGVNFKDTNKDAVLTFDGNTRQQNIVIDIINCAGQYDGDLDFSIKLLTATGLKISMENSCSVKIFDLDHPLASILGTYTGTAEDVGGPVTWSLNLTKDPKDVNVLWISSICPLHSASMKGVYANVSKDEATGLYTLNIPCGQSVADDYQGEGELILCETYISGGYYASNTSTIIFTQTATGFESEQGMGLVNNYLYYNGFLLGEKSQAGLRVVWTKN